MQVSDSGGEELMAVDATESMALALSNLQSVIEESGAIIDAGPLPSVLAVPVLLVQVFQNLVANSIRYAKPGEVPQIRVSACRNGSGHVFSVQDNGIGIEPQYHDRVFGVFKRLQTDGAGTGIGLAVCKAAVERWGGRIWVESDAGLGATFRFTAPSPEATA
jgi:light-regulated signal transduction histidine kinase (bacteriophytochrome)